MGLVLVLAVAGCATDGDGDAVPTPTVTTADTSADPTPEPTSDAPTPEHTPWPEPTRPAEMDRDDIEGAKAAAVYFMELYQYVYATGDVAEWEDASLERCEFCRSNSEHVMELFEAGGRAEGGEFDVVEVVAGEPNETYEYFRVAVLGDEAPSVEYSRAGDMLDEVAGGRVYYHFALVNHGGEWRIWGVAVEGVEA